MQMNDSSNISNKMIDLLVNDILRKNGVNLESAKGKLSEEQKQQIKELVGDLTKQVNQFLYPAKDNQNNKGK
ncbi:spore coat protein [Neobacillus muris]|uniref:spore coat protein n=1 Tax=Neobacillus muris TaxID=2941334 RepID=UPI002040E36E|nr:spore coat protein [Neobacillus muris]